MPISKEDLAQARKTVNASKHKDGRLMLQFSYSFRILVPYMDGVAILAALRNAELFEEKYSGPPVLRSLDTNDLRCETFSAQQYEHHKMAVLLGVSVKDIEDSENAAA